MFSNIYLFILKGKWTLFEEARHVPLLIYHHKSPYKGQKYYPPVELLDIYPTILDFVDSSLLIGKYCPSDSKCRLLNDGKSLSPVILDTNFKNNQQFKLTSNSTNLSLNEEDKIPSLSRQYSVTQVIQCENLQKYHKSKDPNLFHHEKYKLFQ